MHWPSGFQVFRQTCLHIGIEPRAIQLNNGLIQLNEPDLRNPFQR